MAEAAPFAVGTEVLANSTVLGGVGEVERSSSDPRVRSSRSHRVKFTWSVTNSTIGPGKRLC